MAVTGAQLEQQASYLLGDYITGSSAAVGAVDGSTLRCSTIAVLARAAANWTGYLLEITDSVTTALIGQVRPITDITVASGIATITVSPAFSNQVPSASTTTFRIHRHLPADKLEAINYALAVKSQSTPVIITEQFEAGNLLRNSNFELWRGPTSTLVYSGSGGGVDPDPEPEPGDVYGPWPATFVVAASDSESPTGADYVCDGTEDNIEIQTALDNLPTSGGTVLLLDGTYYISAPINVAWWDHIRGVGLSTILKLNDDINNRLLVVTGGDVVLENFKLDGNKAEQDIGEWELNGITIDATTAEENLSNIVIRNVTIKDVAGAGIFSAGTDDTYINDGIKIEGCNISGTVVQGIGLFYAPNAIVRGNKVVGGTTGISLDLDSDYAIVEGNDVSDCSLIGIELWSDPIGWHRIVNNIVTDPGWWAISTGGDHNIVSGNICRGGSAYGIEIGGSYHIVSGNIVDGVAVSTENNADGIILQTYSSLVFGNIISNIGRNDNNSGITLYAGETGETNHNKVFNNSITMADAGAAAGIRLVCNGAGAAVNYNDIENNHVNGNEVASSMGIWLLSSGEMSNNSISGNQLFDVDGGIVASGDTNTNIDSENHFVNVNTFYFGTTSNNYMTVGDGVTAPATAPGLASIYVDVADGDLKIKYADGTVKTIVVDT
jgi:hypothetical protein